jgi:hypothetical protein
MINPSSMKRGDETFHYNGTDYRDTPGTATVIDFWRWGYSRLLADVTRGVLAEFIVARLVGSNMRVSGSPDREYDLQTPTGRTVEVKSSAYLQDWTTRKVRKDSDIAFSGLQGRLFQSDPNLPTYEPKGYHADLFVFCVLTTQDPELVDPLDLAQWRFHVLTRSDLVSMQSPDAVGLNRIRQYARIHRHADVCSWAELRHRVQNAELTLRADPSS